MKLIADGGVDQPIVASLRVAKFDVTYYAELAPGSDDASILEHAQQANTLLLTCDKDFGELVFRNRLITAGVVLIRLEGLSADKKAGLVTEAIQLHGGQMLRSFLWCHPVWCEFVGQMPSDGCALPVSTFFIPEFPVDQPRSR